MSVARPALSLEATQARVVEEWRTGRFDTLDLARRHGLSEPDVCAAIAADQDARDRARRDGKAVRR